MVGVPPVSSPLTWQSMPPTAPGWYWWQPTYAEPEVVRVWEPYPGGRLVCFRCDHRYEPVPQSGRWAGPLPVPGEIA